MISILQTAQEKINDYDLQIAQLQADLKTLQAAGVAPEVLESVLKKIEVLAGYKSDTQDTLQSIEQHLENSGDSEGVPGWLGLVLSILSGVVGGPLAVRYLPNRWVTRGVVQESRA